MSDEFDDDIQEVPSHSPDFRTDLAEELALLAPEAVADGKIDVEKLRELLDADSADDGRERFGLMWPGKSRALKVAQAPTTATLLPDRETSKDWDTTHNVFIEGDNLEVLKILQKHYHGKIKMIYIDPPYNTGNDFIYPDNYKEGLQTYLEWTQQVSEDGKKLSSNPESAGRYHSNWLNMMYPRLKLARNLLKEDGVLAVSIDDGELSSLLKILFEIFGESNFIAQITREAIRGGSVSKHVRKVHDYLLLFGRDADQVEFGGVARDALPLDLVDKRGPYRRGRELNKWGAGSRREDAPGMFFAVPGPAGEDVYPIRNDGSEGRWRLGRKKMIEKVAAGDVIFEPRDDGTLIVYEKIRDKEPTEAQRTSLFLGKFTNSRGTESLKSVFGRNRAIFDFSKPVELLSEIISMTKVGDEELVLDFFSGSASTAHALMALNAEDGGSRRHIQVQLPEPVDPESEAGKAGFSTIADIARERIRRAGEKIKEELAEQLSTRETPVDIGFRSYKLSDTNFAKWKETSNTGRNALEERLAGLRGSADDYATPETLLTELLLKQGYSLTENVSEIEIAGLKVWSVADGALLAIMDEHIKPSLDQLRAVVEAGPVRLVILEDALAGDDQLKTNLVQHAKTHAVELWSA